VQHRREPPTKLIQAIVKQMQEQMMKLALDPEKGVRFPRFLQWPIIRELPAHIVGFGFQPEHVE
jgi:hypothetical protein